MKTLTKRRGVTILDMIALGLGDLGYSLVSCTVATYIVSFGTMALPGVGASFATLMGIATGIAVVCDAISDPIMGYVSDKFKSKLFGRRHLFMLIGLIGMMISATAVWYVPYKSMSDVGIFLYFTLFLVLLRTFNTMYYTPVGAFSVEISNDYNERTTIQAVRSVFYIVGMLLPVVIMGAFQNRYAGIYADGTLLINAKDAVTALYSYASQNGLNADVIFGGAAEAEKAQIAVDYIKSLGLEFRKGQQVAQGYIDFSWVATAICVVTSAFLLLSTKRYIKILNEREELEEAERGAEQKIKYNMHNVREEMENNGLTPTDKEVRAELRRKRKESGQMLLGGVLRNFFSAFKVKELRIIAIGYVVAMMSATLIISLGFNVFTFTFDLKTTYMYVLMGLLLACTIGSQLVWGKIAKKKSKQFSMFTGLTISFIGCCLLFIAFLCRGSINEILRGDSPALGVLILAPCLMIAGFGTGVLYSMPLALVGDVVVLEKERTGENRTGTFAGVMTFCYKAGQGIVTAVSTSLLTAVGFVSGEATQTEEASAGIGWILCVGVVVFVGAGMIIFSRLKLDKQKIAEILERDRKKAALAGAETDVKTAVSEETFSSEDIDAE